MDAIISEVLRHDIDIERADSRSLPVQGRAGGAREGVDGRGEVDAVEVVEAGIRVEDEAGDLLVAQVALGQGGEVGEAVLEDVQARGAGDRVGARGLEDEPAGAALCRRRDRDVVEGRRLRGPAADRGRAAAAYVLVRLDVVDFEHARDGVA